MHGSGSELSGDALLQTVPVLCADKPMAEFTKLLDSAGQMGVEPARMAALLEGVRRRDAQLAAALATAAAAPSFDAAGFALLTERGMRLGLKVRAWSVGVCMATPAQRPHGTQFVRLRAVQVLDTLRHVRTCAGRCGCCKARP